MAATTPPLPRNPAPLAEGGLYAARPRRARPDDPAPERVVVTGLDPSTLLTPADFARLFAHAELARAPDAPPPPDCALSVYEQGRRWRAALPAARPATLRLRAPPGTAAATVRTVVALVAYLDGVERDLYAALVAPWPVSALPADLQPGVEAALRGAYRVLEVPTRVAQLPVRGLQAIAGSVFALAAAWRLDAVIAVLAHLTVAFLEDKGPALIRTLTGAPDDLTAAQHAQLAHELDVVRGTIDTA